MRYDVPAPTQVVLDLLSRADVLAVAASDAILAGDDARLAALLDDREAVVGAVIRVWTDLAAAPPTDDQLARMSQATRATVAAGLATRSTAIRARDQVVAELSALDARQQASHDYQTSESHGSIDVVL